jgi:hypothetical protein
VNQLLMTWFVNLRKRYKITRERPQFWHFPELGVGYIQIPKVATRSIRGGLMRAQGVASRHITAPALKPDYPDDKQGRSIRHFGNHDVPKLAGGKTRASIPDHALERFGSLDPPTEIDRHSTQIDETPSVGRIDGICLRLIR